MITVKIDVPDLFNAEEEALLGTPFAFVTGVTAYDLMATASKLTGLPLDSFYVYAKVGQTMRLVVNFDKELDGDSEYTLKQKVNHSHTRMERFTQTVTNLVNMRKEKEHG